MALTLDEHGFKDTHPLIGGYDAWKAARLPVEPKNENAKGSLGKAAKH